MVTVGAQECSWSSVGAQESFTIGTSVFIVGAQNLDLVFLQSVWGLRWNNFFFVCLFAWAEAHPFVPPGNPPEAPGFPDQRPGLPVEGLRGCGGRRVLGRELAGGAVLGVSALLRSLGFCVRWKGFSVELLDREGEIRASFFNEAAEKHYDIMLCGRCFTLSKGSVRTANKQHSALKHDYELAFDSRCHKAVVENDSDIETVRLAVQKIRQWGRSRCRAAWACAESLCRRSPNKSLRRKTDKP